MYQSIPEFKKPKFVEPDPNNETLNGEGNPEINKEELLVKITSLEKQLTDYKAQNSQLNSKLQDLSPVEKEKSMVWLRTKLGKISEKVTILIEENKKFLKRLGACAVAGALPGLIITNIIQEKNIQALQSIMEVNTKSQAKESTFRDSQNENLGTEFRRLQNELENMKKELKTQKQQNPQNQNLSQQTPQPIPEPKNLTPENPKPVVPANPSILTEPTKLVPTPELKNPTPEPTKSVELSVDAPAQAPTTLETNSNKTL